MNLIYCENCKTFSSENEITTGATYNVDFYENDSCPECGSDDIREIYENEICDKCGEYMEYEDENGDRFCICDFPATLMVKELIAC